MTSGIERTPRRKAREGDEQHNLKSQFHAFLTRRKAQGAPLRFRKNWGGRIAGAGEPDYTGCASSQYWAVELKHPGLSVQDVRPSPAQDIVLRDIERAGGLTLVTNRIDEAIDFIDSMLEAP